jgi:hypothetical protein
MTYNKGQGRYVRGSGNGKAYKLYLHHVVWQLLGRPFPENRRKYPIDHLDHDKLNATGVNLEVRTGSLNALNGIGNIRSGTSKFIGVSWNKKRQMWSAQVHFNNQFYNLCHSESEDDAARARDYAVWLLTQSKDVIYNFPDIYPPPQVQLTPYMLNRLLSARKIKL